MGHMNQGALLGCLGLLSMYDAPDVCFDKCCDNQRNRPGTLTSSAFQSTPECTEEVMNASQMELYSLYSALPLCGKVVHYKGNGVPFGR